MLKHLRIRQFLETVCQVYWRERARRELLGLSEQLLADIGRSRSEALWEGSKPFWKQ